MAGLFRARADSEGYGVPQLLVRMGALMEEQKWLNFCSFKTQVQLLGLEQQHLAAIVGI